MPDSELPEIGESFEHAIRGAIRKSNTDIDPRKVNSDAVVTAEGECFIQVNANPRKGAERLFVVAEAATRGCLSVLGGDERNRTTDGDYTGNVEQDGETTVALFIDGQVWRWHVNESWTGQNRAQLSATLSGTIERIH